MPKQTEFEFNLPRRRRCSMCGAVFEGHSPLCGECQRHVDVWRKGFVKGAQRLS